MPWARPPCTCPSTISGLTTLPMSSTATYLRIFTNPVSVSISVAHRWVPCGKEKFPGSYVASASMLGSTPSGSACAANVARAISPMLTPLSGSPLTVKRPGVHSRSSADTSSMPAAIGLALSITLPQAETRAMPPTVSEREP